MSSATMRLTSASPRNSSRSLLCCPALRCVSACASSAGFENACPSARDASVGTGVREVDRLVERGDEIDVVHERHALFVRDAQDRAGRFALDLDRLRRDVFLVDVLEIELDVEVAADLLDRFLRGARLVLDLLHRLDDAEILDVDRHELHDAIREESRDAEQDQEPEQRDASAVAMGFHRFPLRSSGKRSVRYLITVPMRPKSIPLSQFIQMTSALPTRFASGTKPQKRLSRL